MQIKRLKRIARQLVTLYVNEAPLACVSTSDSLSEIICNRKVMGIKMKEEIRKLA